MSFQVRQIGKEKKNPLLKWKKFLTAGLLLAEPVLGFYRSWKLRRKKEEKHEHRVVLLKRTVAVLIAILLSVALLAGAAKALFSVNFSLRSIVSVAGKELPQDENGYTNFLLAGSGDDSHDGKDLLDTIIIASIDTSGKKGTVMLSLPRDLYFMRTENMGVGRINSLYRDYRGYLVAQGMNAEEASTASLKEFSAEVGRALGIDIHHLIRIDFIAFEQAVDAIGGIDIEVPEDIVDTEYPGPNYSYQTFSISKGLQTLDGATALKYARSRHTTSDFSRSARQQQIIIAGMEKVRTIKLHKDIGKITELYGILSDHIETTLTAGEIISLAGLGEDLDRSRIFTMQLTDQNGLYGGLIEPGGFLYAPPREQFEGASVLLPVSMPQYPISWKQIQALAKIAWTNRDTLIDAPRIVVLNAGAPEGAARLLGGELYRYGFNVIEITNYEGDDRATSFVAQKNIPEDSEEKTQDDAVAFLRSFLKIAEEAPPFTEFIEDDPQIIIVLGEDYRYVPLQDLVE